MDGWKTWPDWRSSMDSKKWVQHVETLFTADHPATLWPDNLLERSSQASVSTRVKRAATELFIKPGRGQEKAGSKFAYKPAHLQGRYMLVKTPPDLWSNLERKGYLPKDRHPLLRNDFAFDQCLADKTLRTEFDTKTSWKLMLAGA